MKSRVGKSQSVRKGKRIFTGNKQHSRKDAPSQEADKRRGGGKDGKGSRQKLFGEGLRGAGT